MTAIMGNRTSSGSFANYRDCLVLTEKSDAKGIELVNTLKEHGIQTDILTFLGCTIGAVELALESTPLVLYIVPAAGLAPSLDSRELFLIHMCVEQSQAEKIAFIPIYTAGRVKTKDLPTCVKMMMALSHESVRPELLVNKLRNKEFQTAKFKSRKSEILKGI